LVKISQPLNLILTDQLKTKIMKLKRRFKKALFAFFKDEIINSVDFVEKSERINYVTKELNLITIKSEIVIEESRQMNNIPFEYVYEDALNKCKHDLFQKVMKHIQIDNQSVMETSLYRNNTRAIRVSLFIGNKN